MRFTSSLAAAILAATAPVALAQTYTTCNPTEKSCPADTGLDSSDFSADFTQGSSANASFSAAAYSTINYGSNGAEFSIDKALQAPTIQTDFYFLFGHVDVKMRAAPGQGIISSIVLESDDLDEIDWEFTGGDSTQVQSNFFGKGNTTLYDRVQYISVSDPQNTFHTYSVDWNQDRLQWIIDGTVVRTLEYNDPLTNGGSNYPQTPMRLKLGNWCGGCAGEPEGTVQWAGGQTTFDNAPYVMYVESVSIHNNNPANNYVYGDLSGSWKSIKIDGQGSASDPSSSSSASGTASASAFGAASSSGSASSASAPTSSILVAPVSNTLVVASVTPTGSAYSTNSASISAQNPSMTTHASLTTSVPGQQTTKTSSGSSSSATGTSGASIQSAMTGASLLSIVIAFFML